jgi:hypothetical protein
MAQDFFRIYRGLELNETVQLLEGAGAPGTAGDSSLAPVASQYMNTTDGSLWTKITAGVGTDKWVQLASKADIASQISWREPVIVDAGGITTLPVGTAGATITIDGQTINDGGRVLFSDLLSAPNVYIYNKTNGVFVQDTNLATNGDMVFVDSGTAAGKQYAFNGGSWVLANQSELTELGYVRTFIGKTGAGSETPTYSSTNFVVNATSLETAIGALDTELGANVTNGGYVLSSNKINANIQALDTAVTTNNKESNSTNVTTVVTLDAVVSVGAKWVVRAVNAADSTNVMAMEIFATHNGVSVDMTRYAVLKMGTSIAGLTFDVTLSVGGTLNLVVSSTTAVNVTAKRVTVL